MSSRRPGENPYRPYYIPPSIEQPIDSAPKPDPQAFAHGNATHKYASRARDIFSDLDYKAYIAEPSPSVVQSVKEVLDGLIWKYTTVLLAQPFEVAKTVLQVRMQDDPAAAIPAQAERIRPQPTQRYPQYDDLQDSDSDLDEPAYFTSNMPGTAPTYSRSRRRRSSTPSPAPRLPKTPALPEHQLVLRTPDSVLEVISQLWQKEGAWGVWKGSNATFVYSVLQSLLENWSRGMLSALLNVPDLGVRDEMDRLVDIASPYPWASFFVAAAAAVTTGLILSPLDVVRTRLVLMPTSRGPRSTLSTLRRLPSYFCAPSIFAPTVLYSLIHPILTLSTPLVLRTHFLINRELSPLTFSVAKFFSSSMALFVKLPLETVLRRGQVALLSTPAYVHALDVSASAKGAKRPATHGEATRLETVVPTGEFSGVFGTMYNIVGEEGSRAAATASRAQSAQSAAASSKKGKARAGEIVYRRGQGLGGLWRGWKVSWWGLVGIWAAGAAGRGGNGEF